MDTTKRLLIACVIGTRPELIKMAPVIFLLQQSTWASVYLINTAQHRHLLDDMLSLFQLTPDLDLDSMIANQSLGQLTGNLCLKLDALFSELHVDAILAQGDTTTVFATSLIAFYHKIPFGHIEAGLRTYNIREPFPEEINRILTTPLATWHFAPTIVEQEHLLREHIPAQSIMVTGNTVIDSLYWVLNQPKKSHPVLDALSDIIVVTAHRRENIGVNIQHICQAIIELSQRFKHLNFVFPVHPNPNVQRDIVSLLEDKSNVHLLAPLRYDEFAHLLNRSILVLTDSGGIQEEAPALKKPVVVLRHTTERPEIITEGVGVLVGTDKDSIVQTVSHLLTDDLLYARMSRGVSPYGDGHAALRIVACLEQHFLKDSGL